MSEQAFHIVVHGKVQGVFFRANTEKTARDLGLRGWVRNRPDGTVEIHAEGESAALDRFVNWCHKGPPLASVTRVDLEPVVPQGLGTFEVQ